MVGELTDTAHRYKNKLIIIILPNYTRGVREEFPGPLTEGDGFWGRGISFL